MTDPLISVILVNWNGMEWLGRCLESLTSQTYSNKEIILVDNGSTDSSCIYVEEKFPSVKIIRNNLNEGFACGNNHGIKASTGELILLVNTDTWVENNFIEKLHNYYSLSKNDVVAPYQAPYDADLKTYERHEGFDLIDPLGHPIFFSSGLFRRAQQDFYLPGFALLFSKQLYYSTGGLDENYFMYVEEVDWFWRLHLYGKRIGHAPGIYIHHAGGGSNSELSSIKYNSFLWRNENTLQTLIKNYKAYNLFWVLPLYFLQNLFEILTFLFLGKPKISWTYIFAWQFNFKKLPLILKKRREIQQKRIIGDIPIFQRMFLGPAKVWHFYNFIKHIFHK